ncbi:hypothetical protein C1H46_004658 [Malus baccata]|uniref:Uncharacterized protein n=1 Tax=Malus baccata TaxID=106549 RepID=A0A540NF99_MALBA|nr:hypothetical protein C1H46_004658 [Malus baccata]
MRWSAGDCCDCRFPLLASSILITTLPTIELLLSISQNPKSSPPPKRPAKKPPTKGSINYKNDTAPGSVSSATFADLPGPELKGESMAEAPIPRLDRAAIQIKNLLFVFSGNEVEGCGYSIPVVEEDDFRNSG